MFRAICSEVMLKVKMLSLSRLATYSQRDHVKQHLLLLNQLFTQEVSSPGVTPNRDSLFVCNIYNPLLRLQVLGVLLKRCLHHCKA